MSLSPSPNFGRAAATSPFCRSLTLSPTRSIGEMRRFGVDASHIVRGPGRMGIYFVEAGANQRPSKVVYDRDYSAIALAKPGDIDWNEALAGVTWFHITGITPAISASAAELALEGLHAARALGHPDLLRFELPQEPLEVG